MKSVVFSVAACLCLAGCDLSPEGTPGTTPDAPGQSGTSPIDGRPIVRVTAADFATGAYVEQVRDDLATRGVQVAETAVAQAARGTGTPGGLAPVLLKDVYAGLRPAARTAGGSGGPVAIPSTHIAIVHRDGSIEGRLLTLELGAGAAVAARGGDSGGVYIVGDPDIDASADGSETYEKEAVSLTDPSDTRMVTFDHGAYSVEGDPTGELVVVGSIPIVDGETQADGLRQQSCTQVLARGESGEAAAGCTGSGGGSTGGGSTGGGSTGGGSPNPFPSYMYSNTYLGLRTLRTNDHGDHGRFLEVQMHVQPTDSYVSAEFPKKNDYRFDRSFLSHNLSNVFGPSDLYTGPAGGPGFGGESQWNAVLFPAQRYTRFFWTPDVNRANTDYDFMTTGGTYWVWDASNGQVVVPPATPGAPVTTAAVGYINVPSQEAVPFPLHALTTASWRGLMIEDDTDVRHFARAADSDWEGDVTTFDFSNGSYTSLRTRIDSDPWAPASDDVFDRSGYRRATLDNVIRRSNAGLVRTDADGFRYTFSTYTVTTRLL